ncbi:hypothetical protein ACWGNE_28805, partial [Streptomyces xiamenensis]
LAHLVRVHRRVTDQRPEATGGELLRLGGRLPEPVARAIHTAAEQRRATWRANAVRRASHPSHDTATAQ